MTKQEYITKVFNNEDQFQAATFQYIHNNYPMLRGFLFHVPNGGSRDIREGAKLKAMGVIPGIPDLLCIRPLFALELKMPNGRVSPEQRKIHELWGIVHVCWNAEDVCMVIESLSPYRAILS